MRSCLQCIPPFSFSNSLFHSPLKLVRKNTKKELGQTLYTQKDKLETLVTALVSKIKCERNKLHSNNLFLKLWNSCFFNASSELTKTEKLVYKISKIIKRGTDGVSLTPKTTSAIQHLTHYLATDHSLLKVTKGKAISLPALGKHHYFKTPRGIFSIEEELGRGGNKTAKKIFNMSTGKYAVLLAPKDAATPPKIHHIQCEKEAFVALKGNRRTIQCKEITSFNEIPSFIVSYANRGTLQSRLSKLTEKQRESLAIHILEGLVTLHQAGIIHRDIKPANILLVKKSKAGQPPELFAKIADFDLCVPPHLTCLALKVRKSACGTKGFFAPELWAAAHARIPASLRRIAIFQATTPALDIYSTGMTLFYLFGGKIEKKEGEKTNYEVAVQGIRKELAESATSVRFAPLILSMLAADPLQRPSAQEALNYLKTEVIKQLQQ